MLKISMKLSTEVSPANLSADSLLENANKHPSAAIVSEVLALVNRYARLVVDRFEEAACTSPVGVILSLTTRAGVKRFLPTLLPWRLRF
jgi:hypothetical protein